MATDIRTEISIRDMLTAPRLDENWVASRLAAAGIPTTGVILRKVDFSKGMLTSRDSIGKRVFIWHPNE